MPNTLIGRKPNQVPINAYLGKLAFLDTITSDNQFAQNINTFLTTPTSENLATAITNETGTGALVFATSPTLVTPDLGTPTSGTLYSCTVDGTNPLGFRNIPINSQSNDYQAVLADAGKCILHPAEDNNSRVFTIPPAYGASASPPMQEVIGVNYPIGTVLSFINMSAQPINISIPNNTMYLAGTGTTGTRILAQFGTATALKLTTTTWIISGAGLT